jgi:hypothetical protein
VSTVVYKNAFFAVNGTDLSSHTAELTLNYASEMLDETAFGDGTRIRKGGLYDWSVEAMFHQDFAAGAVDATLFALVGTTTCLELRPVNACSSANNPIFTGIGVLENYPPMGGAVGALLDVKASWQSASPLSRASSSA